MLLLLAWPATPAPGAGVLPELIVPLAVGQKSSLDQDDEEPPLDKPGAKPKAPAKPPSPKPAEKTSKAEAEESKPENPPPATPMPDAKPTAKPDKAETPSTPGPDKPAAKPVPGVSPLDREGEEEPAAKPAKPGRAPAKPAPKEETQDEQSPEEQFYDVVYWTSGPHEDAKPFPVVPFPRFLGFKLPENLRSKPFKLQSFTSSGKLGLRGSQVFSIEYYEQRMGKLAAEKLGVRSLTEAAAPGFTIDRSQEGVEKNATDAERVLNRAIAEHDSAVQQGIRVGEVWDSKFRAPLAQARWNLRLSYVDLRIQQEKYLEAETECAKLAREIDQGSSFALELRGRAEQLLEIRAKDRVAEEDYSGLRALLEQHAAQHPGKAGEKAERIKEALVSRAAKLVREAEALKQSSPLEAEKRLEQAAGIWPTLPELDVVRQGVTPVLRCAYGELPRDLCPLTARTPVERHASALIYEGLVHWVDDPKSGSHYEWGLSDGRPVPLVRGRCFQLRPCKWSDSTDKEPYSCTVEDVRWTVKLLRDPRCPGYSPVWSSLLCEVENADDRDPLRAVLRLKSDHWQILSLMGFKVLPQHVLRGNGAAMKVDEVVRRLGRQPVGTGPYRLAADAGGDDLLRFVANPHYRVAGLPCIREIAFCRMEPTKAVEAFQQGKVDLIYGLPPELARQLRQQGKRVDVLQSPAVWFLAPNYRRPRLAEKCVRLAIAHAIDREVILKQFFRVGDAAGEHVALTGPYPSDSWACNPNKDLAFSPAKATGFAEEARQKLRGAKLELLCPNQSPAVEACREIQKQVGAVGIDLKLINLDPNAFHDRVARGQDFDLAYWRHDYPDVTCWLEPLLDASPEAQVPGGPNFMGYTPDPELAELFRDVKLHKCFRDIQKKTHAIHEHIARTAVLVPLWQTSTYVAVGARMHRENVLDPLVLFGRVERWRLGPR